MRCECIIADFADKWNPSESTHVECLTCDPHQPIIQAIVVMIDLIRAHTARKQRVVTSATLFEKREVNPGVRLQSELCPREVLLDFRHCFFLHAWMVGQLQL